MKWDFSSAIFDMALFAVKGAVTSMISGYKPEEKVKILYNRINTHTAISCNSLTSLVKNNYLPDNP